MTEVSVTTYLEDGFSIPESAPMVSPHTADGVGTATIFDTTSKMLASGGYLQTTGGNAVNDPQYYDASRANAAGRYLYFKQEVRDTFTSNGYFGLSASVGVSVPLPFAFKDAFNNVQPLVNNVSFDSGLTNGQMVNGTFDYVPTYLENLIVSTNPGAIWLQRHVQGQWMIVYADDTLTATDLYARLTNLSKKFYVDRFKSGAFSSSGLFATFHACATAFTATTSNGSTLISESNGLIRHTVTAATGVTQELMFRRVDDNNCWIVRMDQGASKIYLYEKVAGVETERGASGGTAQTWTNGTAYKILVTADYRNIRVAVNALFKVGYTSAISNITATGVKVSHAGTNLIAYPRRLIVGDFTSSVQHAILPYGDSKTYGQGDTNPPAVGQNGYAYYLTALMGSGWKETPRIARSGYTVALMKPLIDADIAVRYDAPSHILCNLGANDVNTVIVQASFESDYGYILDAFHERFPDARIIVALVGRQSFDSQCNTLNGYIANVVGARSSFASIGPDERLLLKGSDNYATYTVDGVHPNPAGHVVMAAAWKLAIALTLPPPPDDRIYAVSAENRLFTVPEESRLYSVPIEDAA